MPRTVAVALLATVVLCGCPSDTVTVTTRLVPPCNQDDTYEGANYMRLTVMGEAIPEPLTADFEYSGQKGAVPDIPLSNGVTVTAEAFTEDISTASLVARGQSAPFNITADTDTMTIDVPMSRVNAFAKTTLLADGECSEMPAAREGHASTLLPDGKILVSGGVKFQQATPFYSDLLTIYDPGTGTFEDVPPPDGKQGGPLNLQRAYHTATLVNAGGADAPSWKVIIVGGLGIIGGVEQSLAVAEVFDVATNAIEQPISQIKGRAYHTATSLANGDVVFIGGMTRQADAQGLVKNEYRNDAEYYEAATGAFKPVAATMSTARAQHSATYIVFTQDSNSGAAQIEKVMVAGGRGEKNISGSVEFYDHNAATQGDPAFLKIVEGSGEDALMTWPRYGHAAERVTLSSTPDSGDPSVVRNQLRIVVAGGFRCIDKCTGATDCCGSAEGFATLDASITNKVEVFDPHQPPAGRFTSTKDLALGRALATISELPERKLLVAGGRSAGGKPLAEAEILSFDEKGVLAKPSNTANKMADPRYAHTATLMMSGMILVVGGHGVSATLSTTEFFSPQFPPVVVPE